MSSSDVHLGSGQRNTLVKAALQRLKESRTARRGSKTDDPAAEGEVASAPNFDPGALLFYKDEAVEERFIRFIHHAPLVVELILQVMLVIFIAILLVTGERTVWAFFNFVLIFVLAVVESYIHLAAPRREGDALHRLLKIERAVVIMAPAIIVSLGTIFSNYQLLADCSDNYWAPVGHQEKAYRDGYCRYIGGFPMLVYGLSAILQVIRFRVLFAASVVTVVFTATIWMAPGRKPQEDVGETVFRMTFLNAVGLAFVCFIRYVDEKQQRRHFEAQETLMFSAEVLSKKRVEALEQFLSVLPQVVSIRLRDGRWKRSQIDTASDATVLVTRVHDFQTWCTSMVPLQVAALVAAMQIEVDRVLRTGRLERVGRLGDTTLAVGNLFERCEGNMAAATVEAAKSIVSNRADLLAQMPPLEAAVHVGAVEGVLRGAHYVRYEARGPAVDAARRGVQLCGNRGRLLGSTTIVGAATGEDPSVWEKDPEAQILEAGPGAVGSAEPVTFVRLDAELLSTISLRASETQESSALSPNLISMNEEDGALVSAMDRLLQQASLSDTATKSASSINPLLQSGSAQSATPMDASRLSAAPAKPASEPLEIVTDRFGFFRFVDDTAEGVFRKKRMRSRPQQAAKVWLAYAGFVFANLIVLLIDFRGPYAVFGVILLLLSMLCCCCLAVVPTFLTAEQMDRAQTQWTVAGVFVPLLTVFGCALSRPSVVGLDLRAHIAFGAYMRSFCFNDARLQAIGVPLFSLISQLQYLVPGAHDNVNNIPATWIVVLAAVIAARNREGSELKNYRRGEVAEAVMQQTEEVSRVQRGLMMSSMPRQVFDAAVAADFDGPRQVHTVLAVVMMVRASAPFRSGDAKSRLGGLGQVLDKVASCTYLSTAGVLGDDAVVVGPVTTTREEANLAAELAEPSLQEALELSLAITETSSGGAGPAAQSVLVDQDTVAHVVELGARPNYSLLGSSATRLICIAADVFGMVNGLLVTDRVTATVTASKMLGSVEVEAQAPMSVRGQGVLRWNRIRKQ